MGVGWLTVRPPRIRLPFVYRMAHYGGLPGFGAKLQSLLAGLTWVPARDYLSGQASGPQRSSQSPG